MTSISSRNVAAGGKERMIGVRTYQILMRAAVKANSAKARKRQWNILSHPPTLNPKQLHGNISGMKCSRLDISVV